MSADTGPAQATRREDPYRTIRLDTPRGTVSCHHYEAPDAERAMVWIGGVGGGFDTPARGLYPELAADLIGHGVSSLRVRFRDPSSLLEAVADAGAGVDHLVERGARVVGIAGHSFGGAVAIEAAASRPEVRTVVALATQAYGADAAARLGPRCSILLLHGRGDRILPPECSVHVHAIAKEPKRLVLYDGAGHGLDEVADEVRREIRAWLEGRLRA